jgi:hypothetical protein
MPTNEKEREKMGNIPELLECVEYGLALGLTREESELFYYGLDAVGWIDSAGRQIVKWRSKMVQFKYYQQERNLKNGNTSDRNTRAINELRVEFGKLGNKSN